ncbi:RNA polymerase sigma factor [Rhodoplanes sp. TEM]|uniref:RNA polymerase sigma factor n=1 Tax=Rhodoplanes tepidamans TaxID=200616 RepID=A0ABT5JBM2_RHOTP|nr:MULTISPECIES: RNA polymerase sigma factor [Rhodoplanes]MDC7787034.1 RNA polymerase sigma factor [Rhodoplanes tepidamans]MDC7985268.1 RNA polymerase sigma factor [Rhodoplanes sp. TEM]MDQ0354240.1 RNA polymerase sigma-70 factor (ECF subfamily) [Rhodoplanes tepidamans]
MDDQGAPAGRMPPARQGSHADTLRTYLVERYTDLRDRLARRLGSSDRADDALQDTYLRLHGTEIAGELRNPGAYLLRAAYNAALNRIRSENRLLGPGDIDALMHVADDAPSAQRVLEDRLDLDRLSAALRELPPRRRDILLAVRLDGASHREIAARFGISASLVEKELKKAQEHCARRVKRRRAGT